MEKSLLATRNKGYKFIVCLLDYHTNYVWALRTTDKQGSTICNVSSDVLPNQNENLIRFGQIELNQFDEALDVYKIRKDSRTHLSLTYVFILNIFIKI